MEMYSTVKCLIDVGEIKAGTCGVLVEDLDEGVAIEFFDKDGNTIAVEFLKKSDIMPC